MIGIVGYGVIGKATHISVLPEEKNIIIHDINHESKLEEVYNCDVVFICIPSNDMNDIKVISEMIITLSESNSNMEIILRSTITPGFCNHISNKIQNTLTYFPEFLRDRYSTDDSLNCKSMLFASNGNTILNNIDIIKHKLIKMPYTDIEILKFMRNNLNAMKVVFANHFYDICQIYGANYNNVLSNLPFIDNHQSYMEVNENLRGFGGKCLPKDLNIMIELFDEINLKQNLFSAINEDNDKWEITVRTDK